jgi:cytochrome c553
MKKFLKLAAWIAGGFLVAVAITVALNHSRSNEILQQPHAVKVRPVAIPKDAATLVRGKHLTESRGCTDCHGKDLGGAKIEESFPMGKWHGPNLTGGAGSRAGNFSDEDWVRAIRHGVGPDQRPLYLMPSEEYQHLSDADLAAVIAYCRSVPKVERPTVPMEFGPVARMLIAKGTIKLPADVIDHARVQPATMAPAPTAEYGRYLSYGCTGCHGPNFSGGKIEIGPPDWPHAANLTSHADSRLPKWTEEDFIKAIRTAKRPDGTELNPVMPRTFASLDDTELKALWAYLRSLPAVATGVR